MRFAYADPPYLGQAHKHYSQEPLCAEVDHAALIGDLRTGGYDGWALSCSSPSLRILLPLCDPETRVMAWVKPFASYKPNVNPAYTWEPVLVWGGRPYTREHPTVRDWVEVSMTLQKGLAGVKPLAFSCWLFTVLNMEAGDELVDLFPGSGAVQEAWNLWEARRAGLPLQLSLTQGAR